MYIYILYYIICHVVCWVYRIEYICGWGEKHRKIDTTLHSDEINPFLHWKELRRKKRQNKLQLQDQPPLKCMCVIVCVCVCLSAKLKKKNCVCVCPSAKPSQFLLLDTETVSHHTAQATHFLGCLCAVRHTARDSCWAALLQSTGLSYFQVQTTSLFPFARTSARLQ